MAAKVIPVLRDVITPASGPEVDTAALSDAQRAALQAEARVILEELVAESLPALEEQLRERLRRRIAALLGA